MGDAQKLDTRTAAAAIQQSVGAQKRANIFDGSFLDPFAGQRVSVGKFQSC